MVQQPYAESTYRDVSRLLRRLEQNILSKGVLDPDLRGLRKSTYERSRVNAVSIALVALQAQAHSHHRISTMLALYSFGLSMTTLKILALLAP